MCFLGSNQSKSFFREIEGDLLVLLKCFDFLVNTPTVAYILFLGNMSSAFMKQARCLGALMSKGKLMWVYGGRKCRICGFNKGAAAPGYGHPEASPATVYSGVFLQH